MKESFRSEAVDNTKKGGNPQVGIIFALLYIGNAIENLTNVLRNK